jgi:hypothetical protein
MIIGTNAYAPGLTVRWNDIGYDWASLYAPRLGSVLLIERRGDYEWAVHSFIRGEAHRDTITVPRRCDAKRAAEVLVGQWWREKCEREAKPFTVADAVAMVNGALASGGVKVIRLEGPVRGFALQCAAVDE